MDPLNIVVFTGLLLLNLILLAMVLGLKNSVAKGREENQKIIQEMMHQNTQLFMQLQNTQDQRLDAVRAAVESGKTAIDANKTAMDSLKEETQKQLDSMRATVDEKLQKTLDDRLSQSFKVVSERLEQVYKGLGEMQTLASGVGDLKKVLSNVKTRGIFGEIQLGAILEQILSPEQYEREVPTKPGSSDRVEFAIKMPGDGERHVMLPIDAKFPADLYSRLADAYEEGDTAAIEEAGKALETRIKTEARTIKEKYIYPPDTTDFAIMFLPVEGLYAEVVRRGLVEVLQRDYKVNIAGPTTMAALLNSLQMGFQTLAIQRHSSEVWQVLGAVKTEFEKFATVLAKTQERLDQAGRELDKLVGTRTNVIRQKLRSVQSLTDLESGDILGLGTKANEDLEITIATDEGDEDGDVITDAEVDLEDDAETTVVTDATDDLIRNDKDKF